MRGPMGVHWRSVRAAGRQMSKKTLVAVVLFGGAVVYGFHRYAQLQPPLKSEAPKADQLDRAASVLVEKEYREKMAALNLTEDQRTRLAAWEKFDPKGKTPDQRRAHANELKEILSAEQIEGWKGARKEYAENKRMLRESRESRLKAMLGEADYRKNQEDMKRNRQESAARRAAEKTPVAATSASSPNQAAAPTPTPAPATGR